MIDYYRVLNISSQTSSDEIRKAFRREAKLNHPDLYHSAALEEKQKLQKKFVLLTQAYEILSDPNQRRAYDLKLQKHQAKQEKSRINPKNTATKTRSTSTQPDPPPFSDQGEETLEDLLGEVEEMLGKLGIRFKDPLEILVEWAMKVFQEFAAAWKDDDSESQQESFCSHPGKKRSMVEEIEEELQKLKQQTPSFSKTRQNPTNSQAKPTKPQAKPSSPEVDQELRKLKKKYGKSH